MKNSLLFALFWVLGLPYFSFGQEYSYTHYDIAQGLPGSRVYCITQDREGFLWMGTENGVCRFDGRHFSNFTTKDGLPDLEVLQIFADSKGRIWMAPFRKSVCYYLNGIIHTEQNDSLLSKIHLNRNIESFAEDAAGDILMQERDALHLLRADGSLLQYDSLDHEPIRMCLKVSASASGHFLAQVGQRIVEFSAARVFKSVRFPFSMDNPNDIVLSPEYAVYKRASGKIDVRSLAADSVLETLGYDSLHDSHITFSIIADSLIYSNETAGSQEYNVHTGKTRRLLPGFMVTRVFRDMAGNTWFTTMGAGLFRLNSNDIQSVRFVPDRGGKASITSIGRVGNELWVGDDNHEVYLMSLPDHVLRGQHPFFYNTSHRVWFVGMLGKKRIISGSDYGLTEGTSGWKFVREVPRNIKSAVRIDERRLLVGGAWGAAIFDMGDFRFRDTLWRERCTTVFYHLDTIYIGTLGGLYRSVGGRPPVFLGAKVPFLRRRISSITEAVDGTLWIASYDDAGIIGYKNDRQVSTLGQEQGLTSDICRTLLANGSTLWVGTDKGLNRVEPVESGYRITPYTSEDGLASDQINVLFADGPTIYAGTSEGLSFFDAGKKAGNEGCQLYLLSLVNSGRERIADTAGLELPYTDRRVRFEFAGLSYRSAGEITYRYRMAGLDPVWRETRQDVVEYPDLPSGDYEWQLMAVNKFGSQSRLITVTVRVDTLFWKRAWVIVTVWLLSLLSLWLVVGWRVRWRRRQQREKEVVQQRMNELENTALKSQMNPHFIFNCLNSIQQSIFSGDVAGANRYIAGLAGLIRTTLNNSARAFVTVGEEVEYLSSYLELEKMRFKDKIDYELVVDGSLDPASVLIPPMLIQPYVENGLHHGLQFKTEGGGRLRIFMSKAAEGLVVVVEDNGVGRRRADAKKGKDWRDRYPHAMTLTEDRIAILNKLYGDSTTVEVTDLTDLAGGATGTRVVIRLPFLQESDLYF
jgi:ligand-binding sensor domain-containing protein